ncbi:2-hydroxyacid dehydrogenase [Acinetobacter sp. MD2(2019)]|uniref:2-hydroxyacid dehydrogenase n=1 Tax=Acinetobacter sp. MD2(2019) TaxID=2605273 RepID=UPI002D1EBBDA|nr:2-hydroxyacid dehydrogenase [Acinetobacter sp. MD2(2019)]MEB3753278.1 2-hydroxyacid dehydrogenase [Acinetobacter sp. MD2(2019)]
MVNPAVFLDYSSLDQQDLDVTPLQQVLPNLTLYAATSPVDVVERAIDAEIVIVNKVTLDQAILSQLPKLKLILVSATGVNNVDLQAAQAQGIVVCNCQGYGTTSVAQHTLALMFALATNLVRYHNAVQQGRWQQAEQFCFLDYPIIELSGKTLGILGYGELGQEVARLARALGMNVLVGQLPHRPAHADRLSLEELLPQVDILSLHCPLTEQTQNLIGEAELKQMKATAFLINAARGGIVNEAALADALRNHIIAGAATDVLSQEPPKQGNVLLDTTLPNFIITPHSAWGSVQARQRIVEQLAENAAAFLSQQPIRQVNAS